MERHLSDLGLTVAGGDNPVITGLAVDSRDVRPGFLFAAMPGSRVHGAEFVEYALRMDAAAILTDAAGAEIAAAALKDRPAALIVVEAPREALARAAALWFGPQPQTVVAITGTNGKTSVACFLRQIWVEMGLAAVNLGTTGVEGVWSAPLAHTTPEPITLHRTLAEAAQNGVTHAAMEASSHGLDQHRLDGVVLKAAAFTNLSQDHLDYHPNLPAYFKAKAGLFTRVLPEDGVAVVNIDDRRGEEVALMASRRGQNVMRVGKDGDLGLDGQQMDAMGQDLWYSFAWRNYKTRLNLIGDFQAGNVLMAAGLAIACGAKPADVFRTLPKLTTVRGRMELAATRANGAAVFVDFAHTPDAVATALRALRPHVMRRIIAVIGAGGDRDAGKRPLMGQAAAEHADVVFVTDDNPRSEDPASIRAAVMEGCPEATEIGDRAEAILRAVDMLEPGDALLIAGKGHETGQIVGNDVLPFDDAEQASIAVEALDGARA